MNDNDTPSPFAIDQGRLDHEWLRQPRLMRKAGIREADAADDVNRAKTRLDVVEAEIRRSIRSDPASHGIPLGKRGLTEAAIAEAVAVDKQYAAAVAQLNEAKYNHAIATAECAAMQDRRRALERLVELLSIEYFSEPRARNAAGAAAMNQAGRDASRQPIRGRDASDN